MSRKFWPFVLEDIIDALQVFLAVDILVRADLYQLRLISGTIIFRENVLMNIISSEESIYPMFQPDLVNPLSAYVQIYTNLQDSIETMKKEITEYEKAAEMIQKAVENISCNVMV